MTNMSGTCIICQEYKKLSYITNCKFVLRLPNNICSDCAILYTLNDLNPVGFEVICCNNCIIYSNIFNCEQIQNYIHRMIDNISIHKYDTELENSSLLPVNSFIDIFREQNKIIESLKRKIRRQLNDFLIKDLLNIVVEYLHYKNDLFFHLFLIVDSRNK